MRLRVLLTAIALAGSLDAADPGLVSLAIPDSQIIAGINVDHVMLSPFGQYLLAQTGQIPNSGLPKLIETSGFDPRRDLREILVSAKVMPNPDEAIFLARGAFDVPKILEAARTGGATVDTYKGVSFVQMSRHAAMAFPDSTLVISGDPAQVQHAVDRISEPGSIGSAAALRVNQWSTGADAWFVLMEPVSRLLPQPPGSTQPGAALYTIYGKVQQAGGGVKFGANAVVSLQADMPTDQDASSLATVLKSLAGAADLYMRDIYIPAAAFLRSLNVTADGTAVKISLSVPEQQIEQMIQASHNNEPRGGNPLESPRSIRVGPEAQERKLLRRVEPVYPPLAMQARISGVVRMNAIIGKDGAVQNVTLLSGHPLLATAAMDAVKQWVYQPTLLNGQPVEVATQIEVVFTVLQ